jgi:hypothetical protein
MLRAAVLFLLFTALPGVQAQQVQNGAPASVLSPTSPGVAHGAPSSVTSAVPAGRTSFVPSGRRVVFGSSRRHNRRRDNAFVPVPIFVPAYPVTGDTAYADPQEAPADATGEAEQVPESGNDSAGSEADDAVRQAYFRGAHDALAAVQRTGGDSRYGEHYLDSREKSPSTLQKQNQPLDDDAAKQDAPDPTPATIFVFKDGHKIETQNYAIQGQTLFDFSNNHLTKVKLAELDLDATKKANDELGITVRLPSAP